MADSVTPINEDVQRRKDIAESYRTLADLIEEIPELGNEFTDTERILVYVWEDAVEKLAKIARALPGRVEKVPDSSYFAFQYDLGGGRIIHVYSTRENVCERKVVGTEKVQVQVEIEPAKTETKTEEREIVEWVCAPLLSKEAA